MVQSTGGISLKHGNNRPKTQKMGHFSHFLGPWWPYKELPRAFSLAHISYRECIGGYMATGAHSEPLTRPLGISLPLSGSNKQAWPVTHPFRSTWPTPPIFGLSDHPPTPPVTNFFLSPPGLVNGAVPGIAADGESYSAVRRRFRKNVDLQKTSTCQKRGCVARRLQTVPRRGAK